MTPIKELSPRNAILVPLGRRTAMTDDKANRGPQDRSRISVSERYEVDYWTKELGVTEDALKEAVASAGNNVEKVREYLGSGS
jgi:hypothetical protein